MTILAPPKSQNPYFRGPDIYNIGTCLKIFLTMQYFSFQYQQNQRRRIQNIIFINNQLLLCYPLPLKKSILRT